MARRWRSLGHVGAARGGMGDPAHRRFPGRHVDRDRGAVDRSGHRGPACGGQRRIRRAQRDGRQRIPLWAGSGLRLAVRPGLPQLQRGHGGAPGPRARCLPAVRLRPSAGLERRRSTAAGVGAGRVGDRGRAVVTLLARVNGRLMELGVPIYAARGGMVVSGEPAWLPAPPAVTPAGGSAAATDPAAAASLSGQLPVFFRAYASGDRATLTRFAAPGSKITSLNGAVSFGSIESMTVPQGGSTRTITVTVKWLLPAATRREAQPAPAPAAIEMTYQLTVVRQGTSWYVRAIGPAADQPGPP